MDFKSGYVTIIGKPNVGKSTLLNTILGKKTAIVSPIAGTTRFSIAGMKNLPNAQIIFFDTPGIYEPKNELEKRMYKYAYDSITDADVILFLVNAKEGFLDYDLKILDKLKSILKENKKNIEDVNIFCVLNKIDIVKDENIITEKINHIKQKFPFFKEVIPISALNPLNIGTNIDLLLEKIINYLPYQEKLFEDEDAFKLPLKLHISEIIREKIFQNVYQEVPKSTAVVVEEIKPGDVDKNKIVIEAYIIVERENHKGIIIGENGKKIKTIGKQARVEIEQILKKQVFLSLHVKVKEKWTKKTDFISQLGF